MGYFDSEDDAFAHEQWWINTLKPYGFLTNQAEGGAGSPGIKRSQKTRKEHALAMIGENNPMYGKKHTPEIIALMSKLGKER